MQCSLLYRKEDQENRYSPAADQVSRMQIINIV